MLVKFGSTVRVSLRRIPVKFAMHSLAESIPHGGGVGGLRVEGELVSEI